MDKCPFCGAKQFWTAGQVTEYTCRTMITETGLSPSRGMECLEAEITRLKGLVQEMGSLLQKSCSVYSESSDYYYEVFKILSRPEVQEIVGGE